jgi:TATA-box binding protein (TBP) (component of TFIID and TFIIIB)
MEIVNSTFTAKLTDCPFPIPFDLLPYPPFKKMRWFDGRSLSRFNGASFLLFRTGSVVVVGANSKLSAETAAAALEGLLKEKLGAGYENLQIVDLTARNLVGSCQLHPTLPSFDNSVKAWIEHGGIVVYEPELFVNAKFKIGEVTLLLYPAGNIILTGASDIKDLQAAAESFINFLRLNIYSSGAHVTLHPSSHRMDKGRPASLVLKTNGRKKHEVGGSSTAPAAPASIPAPAPSTAPAPHIVDVSLIEFPDMGESLDLFGTDISSLGQAVLEAPGQTMLMPPPPPPLPPIAPSLETIPLPPAAMEEKPVTGAAKRKRSRFQPLAKKKCPPVKDASQQDQTPNSGSVLNAIDQTNGHLSHVGLIVCGTCKNNLVFNVQNDSAWMPCGECRKINRQLLKFICR